MPGATHLLPPLCREAEERVATLTFSDIRNATGPTETLPTETLGYEGPRKAVSGLLEIVAGEARSRG